MSGEPPGLQSGIFQGTRSFLEWGYFDKHFFLLDVLNITFQIRHLTHRWTQSGYFLFSPKSGHFCPLPLLPMRVSAYIFYIKIISDIKQFVIFKPFSTIECSFTRTKWFWVRVQLQSLSYCLEETIESDVKA